MKNLNTYINEAWSGVKKQSYEQEVKSWCEEMGIKRYTINSQGEIDVNGNVSFIGRNFEELQYKFGIVNGHFEMEMCEKLTSLKNCPDKVGGYFSCYHCSKLDSLEGCPKEVSESFYCYDCKQKFTKEYIKSLCKVKKDIWV